MDDTLTWSTANNIACPTLRIDGPARATTTPSEAPDVVDPVGQALSSEVSVRCLEQVEQMLIATELATVLVRENEP